MAKKKWIGPGKTATGANWEGGAAPLVSSEIEFVSEKNNAAEINFGGAGGKGRSIEFGAGYTAAITSTATAIWKLGDKTAVTNALKILAETKFEVNTGMIFEFVSEAAAVQKITTGGKTLPTLAFIGEGSSYQLADELKYNGAQLTLTRGTLDTNGQTVEAFSAFELSGTLTRTLKLGASTLKLKAVWNAGTTTNLTFEAGTSTLVMVSPTAMKFEGGGLTYNNLTYSPEALEFAEAKVTGANTFATVAINNKEAVAKKGFKLPSGTVTTLTGLTTNGAAGKLARLEATTEGERHKISKASGVVELKYTVIKDSEAEGGAEFIAGEGCVLENTVGWSEPSGITKVVGTTKIKFQSSNATATVLGAAGTTKVKIATSAAAGSLNMAAGTTQVRLAAKNATATTAGVTGKTEVKFSPHLKVTIEGEAVARMRVVAIFED